jgi:hypothetical protein
MSVWQRSSVDADSVASTVFGKLLEYAIADGLAAFHSDLYHDATRLRETFTVEHLGWLTATKERIVVLWAPRDCGCGSDIAVYAGPNRNAASWNPSRKYQKNAHYEIVVTAYVSSYVGSTNLYDIHIERCEPKA